jgi:heme a synthase
LTEAQWAAALAHYRQVPEYTALHYGMSLADFKTIYFWEYAHRLLGRLIGVIFALPLVWFWLRGRLPRRLAPALLGILALGFAQGFLGWYMVESGLADRLEVSQYRLVAHLTLALAIYSLILWTALGLSLVATREERESGPLSDHSRLARPCSTRPSTSLRSTPTPVASSWMPGSSPGMTNHSSRDRIGTGWRRAAEVVIALVGLTIAAGGFVAGTRAGLIYNTFPLMGGRFVPADYSQLEPFVRNWFENVTAIQFDHRLLAETTFVVVIGLTIIGMVWPPLPRPARPALAALGAAALCQVALGISTLLLAVPVPVAAAHQAGAVMLLTAAIVFRHSLRRRPLMANAPPIL